MMDDGNDDDKWTLVAPYCWHFPEKSQLLTFFQLKPLVVDVFPKNVEIYLKTLETYFS